MKGKSWRIRRETDMWGLIYRTLALASLGMILT